MSSLMATVVVDRHPRWVRGALSARDLPGLRLRPGSAPRLAEHVQTLKAAGAASLATLGILAALLLLLRFRTEGALRLARCCLRPVPIRWSSRLVEMLDHFARGLSVLSDLRCLLWALFWSLVIWVEIGVSHYMMIMAFDVHVPFIAVFLLLALMVIGVSVPTPGGMGGLQFTCALGLTLTSVPLAPKPVIDAASMAAWGNAFVPVTVVGLAYLWKEGLSLGKVAALPSQQDEVSNEGE